MAGYKDPGLQDRLKAAAAAKQKALEILRNKPPMDEAVLAERKARAEALAVANAEKRAARKAQQEADKAAKAAKAPRPVEKPVKPELTDEEKKAIRDAKYAARKAKKKG